MLRYIYVAKYNWFRFCPVVCSWLYKHVAQHWFEWGINLL